MLERFIKKDRRKNRIRSKVSGTAVRPRLAVSVSNMHIIAQLINDETGTTMGYTSDLLLSAKGTKVEKAAAVGTAIAEIAKKAKITTVVFDRGGKLYHGRVKALAETARAHGLEF